MENNNQSSLIGFWENCSQKTKTEIIDQLTFRLGNPKDELTTNCLKSLAGKITYFFNEQKDTRSQAVSSLIGKVVEITQREFKDEKIKGQIYYLVKLANNSLLRARKQDLSEQNWNQITQLTILDKELLFKYRKWIIHKDIVDFYPPENEVSANKQGLNEPISQNQPKNPSKT